MAVAAGTAVAAVSVAVAATPGQSLQRSRAYEAVAVLTLAVAVLTLAVAVLTLALAHRAVACRVGPTSGQDCMGRVS